MGMGDLNEILGYESVRVLAVCDVDQWRLENAKNKVERHYGGERKSRRYRGCDTYTDFRDLIARKDIDAVLICTPDHWHALPAIESARAGKDIFLQKPLTFRVDEGRILSDTVHRYQRILQVGSQQRSDARFRFAAELVRNGRIGRLHTVKVGFGKDPFTDVHPVKAVPHELDYEMWLGPAPYVPYIEERVHPPESYDRPGWLRTDDYCCGMITGWGSHHVDSAHWGMGMEYSGPVEIDGSAEFSGGGIWDVHGAFRIEYTYKNGVKLICTDNAVNKQGVVFEGTEGWVYVRRGFIDAEPKSLLKETIGPDEIRLYESSNHKQNFFECIRTRREPVAPVEIGHRSCTACILGYISMRLKRKIQWDPEKEIILNDDAASRLLSRPYRSPWRL
jgi:predicted dehydrogenase